MTASHGDLDLQSVEQQQGDQPSSPVTLEDLFLHFTREEWEILNTDQKQLYYEVMMGVYRDVLSLGLGASSSFPGSQEGQHTEPRKEFWLDSVVTQVGIMSRQPVPSLMPRENDTGVPSVQGVSGREPQERPLQANVCTQEAHQSIMYETAMKDLLSEALQQEVFMGQQQQCTSKSCETELSFVLQQNIAKVVERESGQPSFVRSPTPQKSKMALTSSATPHHQATHNTDTPYSPIESRESDYTCRQDELVPVMNDNFIQHQNFYSKSKCDECEQTFHCKSALIEHKKFHTGERPYVCSNCGKSFVRQTTFAKHNQHHCVESSACRCDECGKLLSSQSFLVIHKRIHSGERPYICSECGTTFMSKYKLNSHKKVHHTRV